MFGTMFFWKKNFSPENILFWRNFFCKINFFKNNFFWKKFFGKNFILEKEIVKKIGEKFFFEKNSLTSNNYTKRASCLNFKSFRVLHHSVIMWYHTKKLKKKRLSLGSESGHYCATRTRIF